MPALGRVTPLDVLIISLSNVADPRGRLEDSLRAALRYGGRLLPDEEGAGVPASPLSFLFAMIILLMIKF
jgi:hypothetical protein